MLEYRVFGQHRPQGFAIIAAEGLEQSCGVVAHADILARARAADGAEDRRGRGAARLKRPWVWEDAEPMGANVWLAARALTYPFEGGLLWTYLNWALGFHALNCHVTWLEVVDPSMPATEVRSLAKVLKGRLEPYSLGDAVALCSTTHEKLDPGVTDGCVDVAGAAEADLFLNITYESCPDARERARHTALLDIDPGLTQVWVEEGTMDLPPHDRYLTIGEGIGSAALADGAVRWSHTPPCVALDWWPVRAAPPDAVFTTVSNWGDEEWVTREGSFFCNNKRTSFMRFRNLPSRTSERLELALCQEADDDLRIAPHEEEDKRMLERLGWSVIHSYAVAATPAEYQRYIQTSRGEFSCAKPSCVRLQNAWISDRTICYLASGRPAIVQHTGPSRFLPDRAGLFRFRDVAGAVEAFEVVTAEYERECRAARDLAAEYFDAEKVARSVLEQALA